MTIDLSPPLLVPWCCGPLVSYEHASSDITVRRLAEGYTVPDAVAVHLDAIRPSVSFPRVRTMRVQPTKPSDLFVTPDYLRRLYNADGVLGGKAPANSQAFASFLGDYFSPYDLNEFQRLFVNVCDWSPAHMCSHCWAARSFPSLLQTTARCP